jgi:Ca-activated chloride channel family protein
MKVTPEELKDMLAGLAVPEPSEKARAAALEAAKMELSRVGQEKKEEVKGRARPGRLTDRTTKRSPVMRKLAYAAAGLAFCGIAAAVIIPNFLNFRLKSPGSLHSYGGRDMDAAPRTPARAPADVELEAAMPSAPPPVGQRTYTSQGKEPGSRRLPREYVGRDRFEEVVLNPVKLASEEPVSTFSIDVDTASYAFVRRALNAGHLPQKNAVRIEELINYFDYDYPVPSDRTSPFLPSVAVFPTPWNADTKLVRIGLKGLEIEHEKRPRANLVFLLDVSGSMDMPDKLPLLKSAFRMLVEDLDPADSVAIVVYAGAAGTILEPTAARNKGKILDALDRLRAGGSTAGGEGIRRAYALAEANFDTNGVNRVILATDGDFNVGIRDPGELKGFVERKRETGIFLSVLGFGQGNLNDLLMQKLAQNGNGNAAYIDTLKEARKVLVDEAGSTLFTIARDVKIQVEFNPERVAEYRLIGYETRMLHREDFNNDLVDAGDVGAGHSVTALYEITPVGSEGRLIDDLRYGNKENAERTAQEDLSGEYAYLRIRYKLPGEDESRLIATPISAEGEYRFLEEAPASARFAASVAAFGQILRGDPYVKDFSYADAAAIAGKARGEDPFGYRSEFLGLLRLAESARSMGGR